jgi:hypothetical protein
MVIRRMTVPFGSKENVKRKKEEGKTKKESAAHQVGAQLLFPFAFFLFPSAEGRLPAEAAADAPADGAEATLRDAGHRGGPTAAHGGGTATEVANVDEADATAGTAVTVAVAPNALLRLLFSLLLEVLLRPGEVTGGQQTGAE